MTTAGYRLPPKMRVRFQQSDRRSDPLVEARNTLEKAEKLRQVGRLDQAQDLCATLLHRYPDYVGALHTLGLILADKGEYRAAQAALSQAASLNPRDWVVLTALSTVQLQLGAHEMAARTLEQALQRRPDDATVLATLGEIYNQEREYELAIQALRRAVKIDPDMSAAWLGLGRSLVHVGEVAEAVAALEEVVRRGDYSVTCLYSLSQLPPSLVSVDVLSLLETVRRKPLMNKHEFEVTHAFAKASALGSAGRSREAWKLLLSANRRQFEPNAKRYERDVAYRQKFMSEAKHTEVLSEAGELVDDHPVSLFIFGPSRSGKTTLERLVGTLGGVKLGYENPILKRTAQRVFQTAGLPTRSTIVEMPWGLDELCRKEYLEELGERAGSARVFTNTHPGRIYDTYRLAKIIPNVRFIFMKRKMNDITFRIFSKLYHTGNYYSYDLYAVHEYVEWYYQISDALAELLPNISRVIHYEDMIADPDATLAWVADMCGLAKKSVLREAPADDRGCADPYIDFMSRATVA